MFLIFPTDSNFVLIKLFDPLLQRSVLRKRQFCDSRHYVTLYQQLLQSVLTRRPELWHGLQLMDRQQKRRRKAIRQSKIFNSNAVAFMNKSTVSSMTTVGGGGGGGGGVGTKQAM